MTDEPDKPKPVPVSLLYLGRRRTSDGKPCIWLIPVALFKTCSDPDKVDDLCSVFNVKARSLNRAIGHVYTSTGSLHANGTLKSCVIGDLRYSETETNHLTVNPEWIARWKAHEEAWDVADRVRKIEAESRGNDELMRAMRTIRHKFGSTDRIGRLALEVVVLDILRNPSK